MIHLTKDSPTMATTLKAKVQVLVIPY